MNNLHEELAKETGVSASDVKKVFNKLGFAELVREAGACMSQDKLSSIKLGQLKLAVRVGRSCVAV